MFGDGGSQGGRERLVADAHPGLQMARAGLHDETGLVSLGPHGSDDVGNGAIEIEEEIARVLAVGAGKDVDVEAVAVAAAEKAERSRLS